jgi:hypothetical protein
MIIGLCGLAGAGKSTARIGLCLRGWHWRPFAGPLKAMLQAMGLNPDETDGALKEAPCALLGGKTPRHAMQTLGTEWGRMLIDPDLWVRSWAARLPEDGDVVADDVRFRNEAEAIRDLGGRVIMIVRPGLVSAGTHVSEKMMFEPDETIVNDGDRAALRRRLRSVVGVP